MMTQRLTVDDDPLAGTPYRATRLLGRGYSAKVFEAIGPRGEVCAVKVLREIHRTSPRAAWRVLQEARVLATLQHPNLVELRDIGITEDGRPYFAMPRLQGETLRDRILDTGPLSLKEASLLMAGVLDGLDVAHRAGIIHRDIKPSNIFVTSDRPSPRAAADDHDDAHAVLIDFGIAKIQGAALTTTTDQILGTPRYFAPEQIFGGRVDPRTDVYAAGLVLLEAISGRAPYETENTIDIMRAHLIARPIALDELAGLSSELGRIIARALHKSPLRRWPTAEAFAQALHDVFPCEVAAPISHRRAVRRSR